MPESGIVPRLVESISIVYQPVRNSPAIVNRVARGSHCFS